MVSGYSYIMSAMNTTQIDEALGLLGERLRLKDASPCRLVVCGGAGLIAASLVSRETTKDVDVVAMLNDEEQLCSPDPLPPDILYEAEMVGDLLALPDNWLNNGPSREPGGLFQLGLPNGMRDRLTRRDYGDRLTVYFVSRLDQIHFKVFAAVDGGPGRHVDDLRELNPTADEMELAGRWAMTHDVSDGFLRVLKSMFKQMGYSDVADRL